MSELTHDDFLGGRLRIAQPTRGYRAGVDPVLLAACVPARPGQKVLELGCGTAVASLCLARRVPDLGLCGVELQEDYAALARRNAQANGIDMHVVTADLRALPPALRQRRFDHVLMNPPYFDRAAGTAATDGGRELAFGGDTPLSDWLDCGTRRLLPGGTLSLIQHIGRLPDVLGCIDHRLGGVVVCPVVGRAGAAPTRFILQARHSARAPFRMAPALILHRGTAHDGDRESYTDAVRAVLRDRAEIGLLSS